MIQRRERRPAYRTGAGARLQLQQHLERRKKRQHPLPASACQSPKNLNKTGIFDAADPAMNDEPPASTAEGSKSGTGSRGAAVAFTMPLLVGQIYERDCAKVLRRLGRWLDPLGQ